MGLDKQATAQISQAWRQASDELGSNSELVCPIHVATEAIVGKAVRVVLVVSRDDTQISAVDRAAGSRHALKAPAEVSLSYFAYFGGLGCVERFYFAQANFQVRAALAGVLLDRLELARVQGWAQVEHGFKSDAFQVVDLGQALGIENVNLVAVEILGSFCSDFHLAPASCGIRIISPKPPWRACSRGVPRPSGMFTSAPAAINNLTTSV